MNGTVTCEYCTAVMPSLPISLFRRLLAGIGQCFGQRPDGNPARGSLTRQPPRDARDPEIERALARLRDCHSLARSVVPPAEWNANLEWVLGAERDPRVNLAALDVKTADAVVLWLEDLAVSVNRANAEPSPLEDGRPDQRTRQSIARGLRIATEGYVLAFRRPSPTLGSTARP